MTTGVRTSLPALGAAVERSTAYLATAVDPAIVELCRLRIAQIVAGSDAAPAPSSTTSAAGITSAQLQELATWDASAQFDPAQRASLQFAEYFCYSAQSVTDAHVAEVSAHLPPEKVLGLTVALWVTDSSTRLANFIDSLGIEGAAQ
jgi:hypothetical protein